MWQRFKGFFSREEDEADKARQQRAKPKPRQDWLVAVGQGHSPARTLRRESRGPGSKPRRKKFDTARLSFGGLEQVCLCARRPCVFFWGGWRGDLELWRAGYCCPEACVCTSASF